MHATAVGCRREYARSTWRTAWDGCQVTFSPRDRRRHPREGLQPFLRGNHSARTLLNQRVPVCSASQLPGAISRLQNPLLSLSSSYRLGTPAPRHLRRVEAQPFRHPSPEEGISCLEPRTSDLGSDHPLQIYSFVSHCTYPDHISSINSIIPTRISPRQWPSAHAPRPSSGAPATPTTTPSPKPTPQTPTSDGPAMSINPASPCRGPNTGHRLRKNTKSISTRSASATLGDARVSRVSTRPWALARLADFPVPRQVGGAAGIAGRRA
jgi:hypothetical protein